MKIRIAIALVILIGLLSLPGGSFLDEPKFTFIQSDWGGGASSTTARHSVGSHRTGWQLFSSADTDIDYVSHSGKLKMKDLDDSTGDTTKADFEGDSAEVDGQSVPAFVDNTCSIKPDGVASDAPEARVELEAEVQDPFCDELADWRTPQYLPPGAYKGASLCFVNKNDDNGLTEDYVYAFLGQNTRHFIRYSITDKKWESMASTLGPVYHGASLAYPGQGDYMFALRGNNTRDTWRYQISLDEWTELLDLPKRVAYGGALVCAVGTGGIGDPCLYAFRGQGSIDFYKHKLGTDYTGDNESWRTIESEDGFKPPAIGYGSSLVYIGDNKIYALRGADTDQILMYNIPTSRWYSSTTAAGPEPVPGTVNYGGALAYDGNESLYVFRGELTNSFYRYNLISKEWLSSDRVDAGRLPEISAALNNVSYGGALTYDSTRNIIMGWGGGNYSYHELWEYDPASEQWNLCPALPVAYNYHNTYASLLYPGTGDYLYYKGNRYHKYLNVYSMSKNTWSKTGDSPRNFYYGSMANVGNEMYIIPGYGIAEPEFMYYYTIPDAPAHPASGSFAAASEGYPGAVTENWGSSASLYYHPDAVPLGMDDTKEYLFIVPYNTKRLYAYQVDGPDGWFTVKDTLPSFGSLSKQVKLFYPGVGSFLYGIPVQGAAGVDTNYFFRVNLQNGTTKSLAPVPDKVYTQTPFIQYDSTDDGIYIFAGYEGPPNLYKYDIASDDWTQLNSAPTQIVSVGRSESFTGGTMCLPTDGTGTTIYVLQGGNSPHLWKCVLDQGTGGLGEWTALADCPSPVSSPNMIWPNGGRYIYVVPTGTEVSARYNSAGTEYFLRYDIQEDEWMQPAVSQSGVRTGSALTRVGDDIYALTGNLSRNFYRYLSGENRWEFLAPAPKTIGVGASLAYNDIDGERDYVYCLRGANTNEFWRYQISTDTWDTSIPQCIGDVGVGGAMAAADGRLFAAKGDITGLFWEYAPGGVWESALAPIPASMYYGASLATADGYIYARRGYNAFNMYKFNPQAAVSPWEDAELCPLEAHYGSGLAATSDGSYLLTSKGDAKKTLAKYSVSTDKWDEDIPEFPDTIRHGAALCGASDPNIIYSLRGYNTRRFWAYAVSENEHSEMAGIDVEYGGGIVAAGDSVFALKGKGTTLFSKYSFADNKWYGIDDGVALFPAPVTAGGALCYPGWGDSIYAFAGNGSSPGTNDYFYQYSISGNEWMVFDTTPKKLPATPRYGACMVSDGRDQIYALRGDNKSDFWRYSITDVEWYFADSVPVKVEEGGCLTYYRGLDERGVDGDYIYALPGNESSYLLKYHVNSNHWFEADDLPQAPGGISYGASMVYPGFGDFIYVLQGYYSSAMWKYSISQSKWETLKDAPVPIYQGGSLIYSGGEYLYCVPGDERRYFWKFLISSAGSYVSGVKEIGRNAEYGDITWSNPLGGTTDIYVRTGKSLIMDDATPWTYVPKIVKNTDLSTYSSVNDGDYYLQYKAVFNTDDTEQIPALNDITIDHSAYPHKQEMISSKYNAEQPYNRLLRLSWQEMHLNEDNQLEAGPVPGAGIRVQLRTSSTGSDDFVNEWTEWWGPGDKTLTIPWQNEYDFEIPVLEDTYVCSSLIEMDNTADVAGATLRYELGDYQYKQEVMIDNRTGTAGDKAIILYIAPSNANFWSTVQATGNDIRFYDTDIADDDLTYHTAYWDYPNRKAWIYIDVSSVPAATKSIYMLYGSEDAISQTEPGAFNIVPDEGAVRAGFYNWALGNSNVPVTSAAMNQLFSGGETYIIQPFGAQVETVLPSADGGIYGDSNPIGGSEYFALYIPGWIYAPVEGVYTFGLDSNDTSELRMGMNLEFNKGDPKGEIVVFKQSTYIENKYDDHTGRRYLVQGWHPFVYRMVIKTIGATTPSAYRLGWKKPGDIRFTTIPKENFASTSALIDTPGVVGLWASAIPTYFSVETTASPAAFLDWQTCIPIAVTNTSTSNYVDMLVSLQIDNWYEFWGTVDTTDGKDIRFSLIDGTPLDYYIEEFYPDITSAKATIAIPSLDAGASLDMLMYSGNEDVTQTTGTKGIFALYEEFDTDLGTFLGAFDVTQGVDLLAGQVRMKSDLPTYGWGRCYIKYKTPIDRIPGTELNLKFRQSSGGNDMIGWQSSAGTSFSSMPHALYFSWGKVNVYEGGSNRGQVGTYQLGIWYDIKIVLKDQGAIYYYKQENENVWKKAYESIFSSATNLKPFIEVYRIDRYSYTKQWKVAYVALEDESKDIYKERDNEYFLSVYYNLNPVIQPIYGTFYDNNLLGFSEVVETSGGDEYVSYQVSNDGYLWYAFYDGGGGGSWQDVNDLLESTGVNQSNTATQIHNELTSFMQTFATGDFYWRAYLHSSTNKINTPKLKEVKIKLSRGEPDLTYYVDPSGNEYIYLYHADSAEDNWLQYKVTLYSDGEDTPVLGSLSIDYSDSWIQVSAPVAGARLPVAGQADIQWDSRGIYNLDETRGTVDLYYSTNYDGTNPLTATWILIQANVADPEGGGVFTWDIPDNSAQTAAVKIQSSTLDTVYGISEIFCIMGLTIDLPQPGTIFEIGAVDQTIAWTATGTVGQIPDPEDEVTQTDGTIKVDYALVENPQPADWKPIASWQPASFVYNGWDIDPVADPNIVPSDEMSVKVYDIAYPETTDSAGFFTLVSPPEIYVDQPIAGDYKPGDTCPIVWRTSSKQFASEFILEYGVPPYGVGDWTEIDTVNSGLIYPVPVEEAHIGVTRSYNGDYAKTFQIPVLDEEVFVGATANMRIRVRENPDLIGDILPIRYTQASAVTTNSQEITIYRPIVDITRPSLTPPRPEDNIWVVGDTEEIEWSYEGAINDNLRITYEIYDGTDWGPEQEITSGLAAGDGATGSFSWTVPLAAVADQIRIKIKDQTGPYFTESDYRYFRVDAEPMIVIDCPVADEEVIIGKEYTIRWTITGKTQKAAKYNIYYTRDATALSEPQYLEIRTNQDNTGECPWEPLAADATDLARVMLVNIDEVTFREEAPEDGYFKVVAPKVDIIPPEPSSWYATGTYPIKFNLKGKIFENLAIKVRFSDTLQSWDVAETIVSIPEDDVKIDAPVTPGYSWDSANEIGTFTWDTSVWDEMLSLNQAQQEGRILEILITDTDANWQTTRDEFIVAEGEGVPILLPSISIESILDTDNNPVTELKLGGTYTIIWQSEGSEDNAVTDGLSISYVHGNGEAPVNGATANQPANGNFSWVVPTVGAIITDAAQIKVTDPTGGRGTTGILGGLSLVMPEITLQRPSEAGLKWVMGTTRDILWLADPGVVSNQYEITLKYIGADGVIYEPVLDSDGITPVVFNKTTRPLEIKNVDGVDYYYYEWEVPDMGETEIDSRIKIYDAWGGWAQQDVYPEATSVNTFKISLPRIWITHPPVPTAADDPGEHLAVGDTTYIAWETDGVILGGDESGGEGKYLKFEFSPSGTFGEGDEIVEINNSIDVATYPKRFTWVKVGINPDNENITYVRPACMLRVTDLGRETVQGYSGFFPIMDPAKIIVIKPEVTDEWVMGTRENIVWDKEGPMHNDLDIEYKLPDENWYPITGSQPMSGVFEWLLPSVYPADYSIVEARGYKIQGSFPSAIKIKDENRTPVVYSEEADFMMNVPVIDIVEPDTQEAWACGDTMTIRIETTGDVSLGEGQLLFKCTPDYSGLGGGYENFLPTRVSDTEYTWVVNSGSDGQVFPGNDPRIRVIDSQRINSYGELELGEVVAVPQITNVTITGVTAEGEPDFFPDCVLGNTLRIEWEAKGHNFGSFFIEYSNDAGAFAPNEVRPITEITDETARSYEWEIPREGDVATGNNNVMIRVRSSRTDIDSPIGTSQLFTIRGGFEITEPAAGVQWVTNEVRNITWETKGDAGYVDLYYRVRVDPAEEAWTKINDEPIENSAGTNSYPWTVPDARTCTIDWGGTQEDTDPNTVQVKVQSTDEASMRNESGDFEIAWYTVTWYIKDMETFTQVSDLSVYEAPADNGVYPGWTTDGAYSLSSPVRHDYPHGTYTTYWNKDKYIEGSKQFTTTPTQGLRITQTVYVESEISAKIEWHVQLSTAYDEDQDRLKASAWLERRGILRGRGLEAELERLQNATLEIYDGESDEPIVAPMVNTTPDNQGVFWFDWSPTVLQPGNTYFVKASITYSPPGVAVPAIYTSGAAIDVTAEKELASQTDEILASISQQTDDITAAVVQSQAAVESKVDTAISQVQSTGSTITSAIEGAKGEILADTATIITATTQDLPQAVETSMKSAILNRENCLKKGESLVIRYRTYSGLEGVVVTVYSPKNKIKINGDIMAEIGETGVYEKEINFDEGWGVGDFTVICSEPTYGSMDALIVTILKTDIEVISNNVSAIMGTTSSLTNLKDVADALDSQFSIIENTLSLVGKSLVKEVKDAVSSANEMEQIFKQLSKVSKAIKAVEKSTKNVNLEKFYELEVEKKQDIKYLRNKTQELKAVMDLQTKLIDNVANEPVIQTWYEYGSVILKALIANPSEHERDIPFKMYLPKEAKPEHILSRSDLDVAYDTQQGSYYVHATFKLQAKEAKAIEVELKDIWEIKVDEIESMRQESQKVYDMLKNTEFSERASFLLMNIEQKLNQIVEGQKVKPNNPADHISGYRENLQLMGEAKRDLALARALLSQSKPFSMQSTWKVMVAIVLFLGILSLGFYIVWQKQMKLAELPSIEGEKEIKPKE